METRTIPISLRTQVFFTSELPAYSLPNHMDFYFMHMVFISEESRSSLDKLWSLFFFFFSWVVYSSPKLCSETANAFRIPRFCILSSQLSKVTANILPDGWSRNVLEETLNDGKPLLLPSSLKGFSHKLPSSQDLKLCHFTWLVNFVF